MGARLIDVDQGELIVRIERTWARDAAAFARVLSEQDPGWGSKTFALAGGHVVLCGRGLYVNRALAVGLDVELRADELAQLIERSEAVGVQPACEVCPATHAATVDLLVAHGFAPIPDNTTSFVLDAHVDVEPMPDVVVRSIDAGSLALWQETAAKGWEHSTLDARRASDAFARAAHVVDGDGMVIAYDAADDRPLGCASLTTRDGVATLGGMSTIPSERRRGVQAALIAHRIDVARAAGCDVITSSAATGGASGRNLVRHGFMAIYAKQVFAQIR